MGALHCLSHPAFQRIYINRECSFFLFPQLLWKMEEVEKESDGPVLPRKLNGMLPPKCWLARLGSIMRLQFYRTFTGSLWFVGLNSRCWLLSIKPYMGWDGGSWRTVIILQVSVQSIRSSGEDLLWIPPLVEATLAGSRSKVFSIVLPQLWNSLPGKACLAPVLDVVEIMPLSI